MEFFQEKSADTKYRVMLVDDNDLEIKSFSSNLSDHFYISFAETTGKAWELLNRTPPPDVILLDVMMPDNEGLEFCKRLRDSQYTQNIPVVFLSADDEHEIKSKAFEIGCADYIPKPPSLPELVSRIKRHASLHRKTKHLESLIYIDPLTHLPNDTKFKDVLEQEWSRCARYWHHISLLLISIENMHEFKEEFGKDEYYSLTASIADGLSDVGARPGDLFAYLGHDCFGLLLVDCSTEGAYLKARQVLDTFNDRDFVTNKQSQTASIDCLISLAVAAPAGGGEANQLMSTVNELLVTSKDKAKDGIIALDTIIGAG